MRSTTAEWRQAESDHETDYQDRELLRVLRFPAVGVIRNWGEIYQQEGNNNNINVL